MKNKKDKMLPVYLIYGKDISRVESALDRIKKYFAENFGGDINVYSARDTPAGTVIDDASTVTLFGAKKLVIARSCDDYGVDDCRQIVSYINDPFQHNCAVFVFESLSKQMHSSLKNINKSCVKYYPEPKSWDLPEWIKEASAGEGKKINSQAAELLAEIIGDNSLIMKREIEKLATYSYDKDVIGEADVYEIASGGEGRLWDLVNNIIGRNMNKAIAIFRKMDFKSADAVGLIMAVHKKVLELILSKSAARGEISADDMALMLKINIKKDAWKIKKMFEEAEKHSLSGLVRRIKCFPGLLMSARNNSDTSVRVVIEKMIIDFCRAQNTDAPCGSRLI
ncbi:MAG: DNA polymerase III subunit delta [bacterium]|nr:DNA polymerase III subunit delta [bacterium]